MYWSDFIGARRIQRGNMDGTEIETLTFLGAYPPTALVLDIPNGKIYWSDREGGIHLMKIDSNEKFVSILSLTVISHFWSSTFDLILRNTPKKTFKVK